MNLKSIFSILCIVQISIAHICVMSPHQRGAMNIHDSGDNSCYRKGGPCGGTTPGPVLTQYQGGDEVVIQFQQNFNHYQTGYPGTMDISFSKKSNPTSEDDFVTLATIPDHYAHNQAAQMNFSISVTIPDVQCSNCVIRARYMPHKPTESIFYQCSDISITLVEPTTPQSGYVYGLQFDTNYLYPTQPADLVQIGLTSGFAVDLMEMQYDIRRDSNPIIVDQVIAQDGYIIYYLSSSSGVLGSYPDQVVAVNITSFEISTFPLPASLLNATIVAMFSAGQGMFNIIQILPADNIGQYYQYSWGMMNILTGKYQQTGILPKDDTYVNFLYADKSDSVIYLLAGNENDAFGLSAQIFTLDLDDNAYKMAQLDVSTYTLGGIHYDTVSENLYAVSPGLYSNHTFTLVQVMPDTGKIYEISAINSNDFVSYYGGDIGGTTSGTLYYQFFTQNDLSVGTIASINLSNGATTYSPNINGLGQIHNVFNPFG